MPPGTHHPFVKAATVALAITLMSGFVFYRQRNSGAPNPDPLAAFPVDSPETKAAQQQIRLDSVHVDQSLPSSKSGIVFPAAADQDRRAVLPTSKSGPVFEPASMVNDSALKDAKAQDTLK